MMLLAVLSCFILAPLAPVVGRLGGKRAAWLLALLPASIAVYLGTFLGDVAEGRTFRFAWEWVPSLGVRLSFFVDGLSLLMGILVCGIGALILVYSGGYIGDRSRAGRFTAYLLAFLASMLGLVLSDDLLGLFVFWELTSITSYFLIGFNHERGEARKAALQALLVTGGGGLALLAGFLLVAHVAGTGTISALAARRADLAGHALYGPALLLVLAGAFTKSAQFPFHFWLPNAMEAPTPASAFLHAATMVKAGVYLLARLSPALGGTEAWHSSLTVVGTVTLVASVALGTRERALKRILAYTTVAALGTLTLLVGVGTPAAFRAAAVFLAAHALYKGALFLVAGSIDHETGEREVDRLGGLARAMPATAAAGILAALSMASLPPFFGFLGKEMLYESVLASPAGPPGLAAWVVAANMVMVALALAAGVLPFVGKRVETAKVPHEAPPSLVLGPALLALAGLALGLAPGAFDRLLGGPAADAMAGRPAGRGLALWHGLTPALGLSALTAAGGLGLLAVLGRVRAWGSGLGFVDRAGPDRLYDVGFRAINGLAKLQTRILQSGYLRRYVLVIVLCAVAATGYAFAVRHAPAFRPNWEGLRFWEALVAGLVVVAALAAVRSNSRMAAVAALGVVGYGVSLLFILFGAPDLAMTQLVVETLTVILFVLVFRHLPRFSLISSPTARFRDAAVAAAAGALVAGLVMAAQQAQLAPVISEFYAAESVPSAHGRNVVNVILVDFRALDTLGEITVLAVAAVGVFALLRLRGGREARP